MVDNHTAPPGGTKRKRNSDTRLVVFPIYVTQSNKSQKEYLEEVFNGDPNCRFSTIYAKLFESKDAWGPYNPLRNNVIADNISAQDGRHDEYYVLTHKDFRNVKEFWVMWRGTSDTRRLGMRDIAATSFLKANLVEGSGGQCSVEPVGALDTADYLGIVASGVEISDAQQCAS